MLPKNLNYQFKDPELLKTALRHRSMGKNSNERMEFLGDSILNFIITTELFRKYPKSHEGELSRLRANLVRKETLAALAREFNLGDSLELGSGEKKSGGFRRDSILADAMEAIIGAIYLDSNINICRKQVISWYKSKLQDLAINTQKDAKTELQELLQARKFSLPNYKVIATKGEVHNCIFYVSCSVEGLELITQGYGSSKQLAEQEAAKQYLSELLSQKF